MVDRDCPAVARATGHGRGHDAGRHDARLGGTRLGHQTWRSSTACRGQCSNACSDNLDRVTSVHSLLARQRASAAAREQADADAHAALDDEAFVSAVDDNDQMWVKTVYIIDALWRGRAVDVTFFRDALAALESGRDAAVPHVLQNAQAMVVVRLGFGAAETAQTLDWLGQCASAIDLPPGWDAPTGDRQTQAQRPRALGSLGLAMLRLVVVLRLAVVRGLAVADLIHRVHRHVDRVPWLRAVRAIAAVPAYLGHQGRTSVLADPIVALAPPRDVSRLIVERAGHVLRAPIGSAPAA